jgi:hypothetical protein
MAEMGLKCNPSRGGIEMEEEKEKTEAVCHWEIHQHTCNPLFNSKGLIGMFVYIAKTSVTNNKKCTVNITFTKDPKEWRHFKCHIIAIYSVVTMWK